MTDEIEKKKLDFLIGKTFKYKERFDDIDFTFVKIVEFSKNIYFIGDYFCKGDLCENNITMERTIFSSNEINNMTEIPEKEYAYEVSKLLDIMGLEIKK